MSETATAWLESLLLDVLKAPTHVPLGQTEVAVGDERITSAVEEVLMPRLQELGPDEIRRHPSGDVAARFGPDRDDGILVQTYIVSQHANLMTDPDGSKIVDGADFGVEGRCALGRGATQNKGPLAAAFAALQAPVRSFTRPVWVAVNTEGRSSHDGSRRIIDDLRVRASGGIVAFGTDLKVSLGNRGRVDVDITVQGRTCHSSQPWLGHNPIETAADIVAELRSLPLPGEHPFLDKPTATPYQFACRPVAPHTIPEQVRLVVDRRLLPGDDSDEAVADIRRHLERWESEVTITRDVSMLPADVDVHEPVVVAILDALIAEGRPAETFWSRNTFDAGYACSKGIPTPMFGPGKRGFSGAGLIGDDMIPIEECAAAARVLRSALNTLCSAE